MPRALDVEVKNGRIVAIWHGCLALPFHVVEVEDDSRADSLAEMSEAVTYHAIDVLDERIKKEMNMGKRPEADPYATRQT